MIELAPNNKRGMTLQAPVMLAAGFAGYSVEYAELVDLSRVGAIVTVPTTSHPRISAREPRVLEESAGFLLARGGTNPGLNAVLANHQRAWKQLGVPIIFSLAAEDAHEWSEMARRLDKVEGVAGVELEIAEELDAREAVRAVGQASELPLLAKIPIARAEDFAQDCAHAGADALVIGLPPRADAQPEGKVWKGRGYGAGLKALALRALRKVSELNVGLPLVACGGIHSIVEAREFFAAGAAAIQLDSVLWIEPKQVNEIIADLKDSRPENQSAA